MMKKYILLLSFFFLSLGVYAQFSINYSLGYGTYQMKDMKDIAKRPLQQEPLGSMLKLTDNFPGYITHNADVTYQIQSHEFGIAGAYMSTGARYAYSDYSGKMVSKLVTNAFKIGTVYRYHFFETDISSHRFSVFAELTPSAVFTTVKVSEDARIYDPTIHSKTKEKLLSNKLGLSIQPMLGCRLILSKHFLIHLKAGYDVEFGTKVNGYQRVDWTGFRLNGGVGYMF